MYGIPYGTKLQSLQYLFDNIASENEINVDYSAEEINKVDDPSWIVFPWEEWWSRWDPNEIEIMR